LNLLMTRHAKEPGVQEALLNMLAQLGLVRVDPATGRPVIMMPGAGAAAGAPAAPGALGPGMPSPAAPPAPHSALWTPDQIAPGPAPSEGKSKLWIPGME